MNQRRWFRRRGTFCSGVGFEVWILGCWGACFAVGSWFVVEGGGGIVVVGFVVCCWLSLLFRVSVSVLFVSVLVVVGVGFLRGFVVVVVGVVFGVFLISGGGGACCFLGVDVGGGFFGGFLVCFFVFFVVVAAIGGDGGGAVQVGGYEGDRAEGGQVAFGAGLAAAGGGLRMDLHLRVLVVVLLVG